jgi:hypothetical protein
VTPQPTPQPGSPPTTGDPLIDAINRATAAAQVGGTSAPPDLYGLGQWQTQNVNPGDLPFLANIVGGGQQTTGEGIVKAFAQSDPSSVATIQHALFMAGYYTSDYTPKYGVVSPQDISAFGNAVTVAGQSGQPVAQLLEQGAAYGAAAGVQAAQQQARGGASGTVTLPNTATLEAEAVKAFQSELGKKATPQEAAQFAAYYRAMVKAQARAQTATPLPGPVGTENPADLVDEATRLHTVPMQGPIIPGTTRPQVTEDGRTLVPKIGPIIPGTDRPLVDRETGQPATAGFGEQIGGLMSLGQAVNAAVGTAQPGGITFQDSVVDPSVAASNFARNLHPQDAAANDVANTFNMFLSLLGSHFGG